jgi:hypothetical protein
VYSIRRPYLDFKKVSCSGRFDGLKCQKATEKMAFLTLNKAIIPKMEQ